jgi:hypothetical protein
MVPVRLSRAQPADRAPTRNTNPAIYAKFQKSVEEPWIQSTQEQVFQAVLETNDERFPMILDDLRAMPQRPMILVERARLFPKLLAPLLTSPHQVLWPLLTPELRVNQSSRAAICWPRISGATSRSVVCL